MKVQLTANSQQVLRLVEIALDANGNRFLQAGGDLDSRQVASDGEPTDNVRFESRQPIERGND